jgi:hypothetical protein
MITQKMVAAVMRDTFDECDKLRAAGQAEYAHDSENAMRNFESVAEYVGSTREAALLTYLIKHFDGIAAYVKGHRSQRESVKGRINDAIVYLILLKAMAIENDAHEGLIGQTATKPFSQSHTRSQRDGG